MPWNTELGLRPAQGLVDDTGMYRSWQLPGGEERLVGTNGFLHGMEWWLRARAWEVGAPGTARLPLALLQP